MFPSRKHDTSTFQIELMGRVLAAGATPTQEAAVCPCLRIDELLTIMPPRKPMTRLERFLRSRGITYNDVEREANYTRQSLLRIRLGRSEPRRDSIARIVSALRRLTLEPVDAEDVFELSIEESGVWRKHKESLQTRREDRQRAETFLARLRKLPLEKWQAALEGHPEEVTAGMIRVLIQSAKRAIDQKPTTAAFLAKLASAIEVRDGNDEQLRHLRGCALLEYGNALRHEGKYHEALAVLDEAERLLLAQLSSANEVAQTWYVRAIVLWKRGEHAEARMLRHRASLLFTVLGDARRAAHAEVLEAGILFEQGDVAGARDLWESVISTLTEAGDHRTLAAVLLNLGTAEESLGNIDQAEQTLIAAERTFKRLGVRPEMIRARWTLGRLIGLRRSRARGLVLLRECSDAFLQLGMPAEAAFLGFDLVDVLLLDRRAAAEAANVCREMIAIFLRMGVDSGVAKAIAYLRDAVMQGTATSTLVSYVRTYVQDAPHTPGLRFAPMEK